MGQSQAAVDARLADGLHKSPAKRRTTWRKYCVAALRSRRSWKQRSMGGMSSAEHATDYSAIAHTLTTEPELADAQNLQPYLLIIIAGFTFICCGESY